MSTLLADARRPPRTVAQLTPAHLDPFRLRCGANHARRASSLKTLFRTVPDVPAGFAARLNTPVKQQRPTGGIDAYSRAEFARIGAAARDDVRAATRRIRRTRQFLQQWRDGNIDPVAHPQAWRRGQVLDHIDRHADVPRNTRGRSSVRDVGDVAPLVTSLHLTQRDVAAFVVLLSCLTGQNPATPQGTPVAHHRADGGVDTAIGTALLDVVKPRRGRYRAHMTIPLTDLPVWLDSPTDPVQLSARDQLHTPFGVYTLALELIASSRAMLGTDRLLVHWSVTSGKGRGGGLRVASDELIPIWGRAHPVAVDPPEVADPPTAAPVADASGGTVLVLDGLRLRRTFVELHQKPVAHTDQTLASQYLLRNRRNLADYQKVVARVLAEEVTRARATVVARTLTPQDAAEAQIDPQQVADRFSIDVPTLVVAVVLQRLRAHPQLPQLLLRVQTRAWRLPWSASCPGVGGNRNTFHCGNGGRSTEPVRSNTSSSAAPRRTAVHFHDESAPRSKSAQTSRTTTSANSGEYSVAPRASNRRHSSPNPVHS